MNPSRFTEEQIIGILREQEAGAKMTDVCRKHVRQVIRTLQLAHSHVFGNLGTFRASEASSWGTQQ